MNVIKSYSKISMEYDNIDYLFIYFLSGEKSRTSQSHNLIIFNITISCCCIEFLIVTSTKLGRWKSMSFESKYS